MSETIDELSVSWSEDGTEKVRELDKVVLTRGLWSTILFRYQEWDAKKGDWGDDKYTIRRYQKRDGRFQMKSKFVISSRDQARTIIDNLERWLAQPPSGE
jgi:hypothetical protein